MQSARRANINHYCKYWQKYANIRWDPKISYMEIPVKICKHWLAGPRCNHWSTLQISEESLSSGVLISCNHGPIGCCIYPDDNDVEVVRKCESYLACALDADMLRGPIPLQALSLLLAWLLLCRASTMLCTYSYELVQKISDVCVLQGDWSTNK